MKSQVSTNRVSLMIGSAAAILLAQTPPASAQGWPAPASPLAERATVLDKRFQPVVVEVAVTHIRHAYPLLSDAAGNRTRRGRVSDGSSIPDGRGRGQHIPYLDETDDERSSVTIVFKSQG